MPSDEETITRAVKAAFPMQTFEDLKFKYEVITEVTTLGGLNYLVWSVPKGKRLEVYILCDSPGSVHLVRDKNQIPVGPDAMSTTESEAIDIRGGNWFPNRGYRLAALNNVDPITGDATNLMYQHNGLADRGLDLTEDEALMADASPGAITHMVVRYRDYPL